MHLIQFIRYFGLVDSLRFMTKIAFSSTSKEITFQFSKFKNPVTIRQSQSDYDIFVQVFAELQYDIKFFLDFEPRFILDCGSNVGYSCLFFAHQFPNAEIVGIEPDERNFSMLKRNTEKYSQISNHQAGIWYKKTRLSIKDKNDWSASIAVEEGGQDGLDALTIPGIMHDKGYEFIDILKLDVEGAEKCLFEHDPHGWLNKVKCLVIELHDQMQPGTSRIFFREMAKYDWITYAKGENIICIRNRDM